MDEPPLPSAAPVPSAAPPSFEVDMQQVHRLYKEAVLCMGGGSHRSALLDSELLAIFVTCEFRGHQGRVVVTVVNRGGAGIQDLACTVVCSGPDSVYVRKIDPPPYLPNGGEAKISVAAECFKPFDEGVGVHLSISFSLPPPLDTDTTSTSTSTSVVGREVNLPPLKLPVTVASFLSPLPCDKASYMNRWKAIEGHGTESQLVFPSPHPVDFARKVVVDVLRLGLAEGLDNLDKTVTGGAALVTGNNNPVAAVGNIIAGNTDIGGGLQQSVIVLMRLEYDNNQKKYRVTVRSKSPLLASALRSLVVELLT